MPAIEVRHFETGISTLNALLDATAFADAGVISPSIESAATIPKGPVMISLSREHTMIGFSPVAPVSAPALSIAVVATEFVPTQRRTQRISDFLIFSHSRAPILPP